MFKQLKVGDKFELLFARPNIRTVIREDEKHYIIKDEIQSKEYGLAKEYIQNCFDKKQIIMVSKQEAQQSTVKSTVGRRFGDAIKIFKKRGNGFDWKPPQKEKENDTETKQSKKS